MKAPLCKLCGIEHYSTQDHGGDFAPKPGRMAKSIAKALIDKVPAKKAKRK